MLFEILEIKNPSDFQANFECSQNNTFKNEKMKDTKWDNEFALIQYLQILHNTFQNRFVFGVATK